MDLPLFDRAASRRQPSAQARWLAFHRENPQVYEALRRLALQAKRAGKRVGMRCLWERLRWEVYVEVPHPAGNDFRLNDHFPPHYARLLMDREPELRGFFEVRGKP